MQIGVGTVDKGPEPIQEAEGIYQDLDLAPV